VPSSHSFPPAAPPTPGSHLPLMAGLGQALRWLREKQARKQYRVADNAGITKGMLSAYETGRQRPSLETLEKILQTLGCDLNDLHNALQIVNGHPERIKGWRGWQTEGLLEPEGLAGPGRPESGAVALGSAGFARSPGSAGSATANHPGGYYDVREAPPPPYCPSQQHDEAAPPVRQPAADSGGSPISGGAGDAGGLSGAMPSAAAARRTPPLAGWSGNLDSVLGRDRPRLQLEEEQALNQMMDGFHSLVRFWHRSLSGLARRPVSADAQSGAARAEFE
jgi:transcriptional regulator with XRE-family HTH domain